MCGLVGIVGNISDKDVKAFKQLLVVDSLRGPHSTGVMTSDIAGSITVVKKVGNTYELFDSVQFNAEMRYKHDILMGHNRYASIGKITKSNAHPFECEHITGAHNGTLTTKYLLKDNADFETDSENLFHHMAACGVEDTCKLLGGAYALTWHNDEEGTLNFLRNSERPLCYVYSTDGSTLYWASEMWMLYSILDRCDIKHGNAEEFKVNTLYTIEVNGSRKVAMTCKAMPKYNAPVYTPITDATSYNKYTNCIGKVKEFRVVGTSDFYVDAVSLCKDNLNIRIYTPKDKPLWCKLNKGVATFSGRIVGTSSSSSTPLFCIADSISVKEVDKVGTKVEVIHKPDISKAVLYPPLTSVVNDIPMDEFDGYNGQTLTHKEWLASTSRGCSFCQQIPDEDEHDELVWVDSYEHLCHDCANSAEFKM